MITKLFALFWFFVFCECVSLPRDVSEVTWTHEVDNLALLRDALQSSVTILVVDISKGPKPGAEDDVKGEPVPLIGPQLSRGDITLESWLDTLLQLDPSGNHGIKLKFQDPDAIVPSLKALRKRDYLIHFPIFLHGDVLDGPENTTATLYMAPVAGDFLLQQSDFLVPLATVSLGWATAFQRAPSPLLPTGYSWKDVTDMATICRCSRQGNKPDVTFQIRSVFIKDSMDQLKWLLETVPSSSLTVWSSIDDVVIVDDLLLLRRSFPFDKVYYDLPRYADEEFRRRKDSVPEPGTSSQLATMTRNNWILLPNKFPNCQARPLVSQSSIAIKYLTEPVTLLFTDKFVLPVTIHGVLSPYILYNPQHMKSYEANRFIVLYSTDSKSSTERYSRLSPNKRALTYTANDRLLLSDCNVRFLVRITENGVTCAVQDMCETDRSAANTSRNSDCNAFDVVGQQPINIGLYFEGWRGWVVHNLTISTVSGGLAIAPELGCLVWILGVFNGITRLYLF